MKMKISGFKLKNVLLLIAFVPLSLTADTGKEFTKSIVKEFDITRDGTVGVINKYGSIDVRTWDASRVKIEVTIKTDVRNEDAANEVFNRITVTFDNSPSVVRAKTDIETVTGWKSWFNWGSNDQSFEINYVVHLPATVVLELDNKYGDIYVSDMQNRALITLKYGDMKVGNIAGGASITMGYADGTIQSTKDVTLDLAYSDLYLGNAGKVSFRGKYSDLSGETFGDIDATTGYVDVKLKKARRFVNTGKYDDFMINDVQTLSVSSKYSSFNIGKLHESARLEMGYGSVNFEHVQSGFRSIDINTTYTDVKIEVDAGASFVLDATTKYCGVRHSDMEIYHEIDRSSERIVKGYRGSRDASSRITAVMNYGELSVK